MTRSAGYMTVTKKKKKKEHLWLYLHISPSPRLEVLLRAAGCLEFRKGPRALIYLKIKPTPMA